MPANSTIADLSIVYWGLDTLTSADIAFSDSWLPSAGFTTVPVSSQTFLFTNQFGYAVYKADFIFPGVPWSGAGWVSLQNACTTSGCDGLAGLTGWDENDGPSSAFASFQNFRGEVGSESFTLSSGGGGDCFSEQQGNFKVIHEFSGQQDGATPEGLTIDKTGALYIAPYAGGAVLRMARAGSDWFLNSLYTFAGGSDGSTVWPELTIGPDGVYGTSNGGIQNCYGQYCGQVFRLKLTRNACGLRPCNYAENVLYKFTGDTDAYADYGPRVLVFDQAGNLYGTSFYGGAQGNGAVFELKPSSGGWTESILYSFANGSDGTHPSQVLVGKDGNLYGIAEGGDHGYGVIFELAPSGSGWTQKVIYSFQDWESDGYNPANLVQDSAGNLFGTAEYFAPFGAYGGTVFTLTRYGNNWIFNVLANTDPGSG